MTPAQIELLGIRLEDIQRQLGKMETKEDVLLAMLEHVEKTLAEPQVVTPRFPAWMGWLLAGYMTLAGAGAVAVILLLWNLVSR